MKTHNLRDERGLKNDLRKMHASVHENFKEGLQNTLSEILGGLYRSRLLAIVFLVVHIIELLSLSVPKEMNSSSEFMSMVQNFLLYFNFGRQKETIRMTLIICSSIINISFALCLFLLTGLGLSRLEGKETLLKFLRLVCTNYFQFFMPILFIPMSTLALRDLLDLGWAPEKKVISIFLMISTFIASISVTSLQVNFGFNQQDHMFDFPRNTDYGIVMIKLAFCSIINQEGPAPSYIAVCLFAVLIFEYCTRFNYIDVHVSQIYFFLLLIGFAFTLANSLKIGNLLNRLDPSLVVLILGPLLLRLAKLARSTMVRRRIMRAAHDLMSFGEVNLFSREVISHLDCSAEGTDIENRSELFSLVNKHIRNCKKSQCKCRTLNFNGENEAKGVEELISVILNDVFQCCLRRKVSSSYQGPALLNYVAFMIDFDQSPNKALTFMFENEKKINSFSGRIGMKILEKRCKKILEKKLDKMEQVLENFSEVIEYERHVKHLDIKMKKFLVRYIQLFAKLQPNRHESLPEFTSFALQRGSLMIEDIKSIKKTVLTVLEGNPDNLRIIVISKALNELVKSSDKEVLGVNIASLMPQEIQVYHQKYLSEFIESETVALIRDKSNTFIGIDKECNLININVNIRLDTFFMDTFLVGALITKSHYFTKSLICNDSGGILYLTEELEEAISIRKFMKISRGQLNNIVILIPQLFEKFLDFEEISKGFLLKEQKNNMELELTFFSPSVENLESEQRHCVLPSFLWEKSNKLYILALLDQTVANIENTQEIFSLKVSCFPKLQCRGQIKYIFLDFLELSEIRDHERVLNTKKYFLQTFGLLRQRLIRAMTLNDSNLTEEDIRSGMNNVLIGGEPSRVKRESLFERFSPDSSPKAKGAKIELYNMAPFKYNNSGHIIGLNYNRNSINVGLLEEYSPQNGSAVHNRNSTEKELSPSNRHPDLKFSRKLQSLEKSITSFSQLSKMGKSYDDEEEESENAEGIKAFTNRSPSKGSSSKASTKNQHAIVYEMDSGSIREFKFFKLAVILMILSFLGLMFYSWSDYLTKAHSIYDNIGRSNVLQGLIIPLAFNVNFIVLKDFLRENLFKMDSKNERDFWEYLNFSENETLASIKQSYNKKLQKGTNVDEFLFSREVVFTKSDSLRFINQSNKKLNLELDLDQAFNVLSTEILNLRYLSNLDDRKYSEAIYFILINFRSFIKSLIDIFPEIDRSMTESLSGIIETNQLILIIYPVLLFFLFFIILKISYKIKKDAHQLVFGLKRFDSNLLIKKIHELSRIFKYLYPSNIQELNRMITDISTQELNQNQRANLYKKTSTYKKIISSNTLNENSNINKIINIQPPKALYLKLSLASLKLFLVYTILIFAFCLGLPILGIFINNYIVVDFEGEVSKVVSTTGGIQQFMTSFITISTLKQVDYILTLKKDWPEASSERKLINTYFNDLNQILKTNSNPMKILEKEEEFPNILKINKDFYFNDICGILQAKNLTNITFTQKFNFESCPSILKGVMKRGSKGLVNEISSYFSEWDFFINETNDTLKVIMNNILDAPGFAEMHFSFKLLQLLEEIELHNIIEVLDEYMEAFKNTENLWFALTLVIVTLTWLWVWTVLRFSLQNTFLNAVDLLKLMPSNMVIGNRFLLSRIFELSRKV